LYGLRLMHRLNIFQSCFGHSGWAGLLFFSPFHRANPNPEAVQNSNSAADHNSQLYIPFEAAVPQCLVLSNKTYMLLTVKGIQTR